VTDKLERQERELMRLRHEAADVQQLRGTSEDQAATIRQLRSELRERDERIGRLEAARQMESQPLSMCRYAVDAFNSSEHADRMTRIARTLGEPQIGISDAGPGVPRSITILLAWDIAWYEFLVKIDLGTGRASIHESGTGGTSRTVERADFTAMARWSPSGLVLTS
jgi:hypothetical protein